MRSLLLVGFVAFLASCTHAPSSAPRPLLATSILTFTSIKSRDTSKQKKYFLIAGSAQATSFAREIVEQAKILLSMGAKASEIACFYSPPDDASFTRDQKKFKELASSLKSCYQATPNNIWELLRDGGPNREFVYLYVTGHGAPPDTVGQHAIFLETGFESFLLTPHELKKALRESTRATTKKFVVVQGCFSGGFARSEDDKFSSDTLADLEKTTVLTASRSDRVSFGCDPGENLTHFGRSYNFQLKTLGKLPPFLDWERLHGRVSADVSFGEDTIRAQTPTGIPTPLRSEPVLLQTTPKLAE